MSSSQLSNEESSPKRAVPRRTIVILVLFVCLVIFPIIHGVIPWALSLLSHRYGWAKGHPASWNLIGLIPLAIGAGGQVWILITVLQTVPLLPERVPLSWKPMRLVTRGPYTLSRNPIYVADLILWLGWTLFFGSFAVFTGCIVLWMLVSYLITGEERELEAHFGEDYLRYKATAPRWFGKRRD
jgi:protein-S-isoprenylcysteine O-methyltransferase Ste14